MILIKYNHVSKKVYYKVYYIKVYYLIFDLKSADVAYFYVNQTFGWPTPLLLPETLSLKPVLIKQ